MIAPRGPSFAPTRCSTRRERSQRIPSTRRRRVESSAVQPPDSGRDVVDVEDHPRALGGGREGGERVGVPAYEVLAELVVCRAGVRMVQAPGDRVREGHVALAEEALQRGRRLPGSPSADELRGPGAPGLVHGSRSRRRRRGEGWRGHGRRLGRRSADELLERHRLGVACRARVARVEEEHHRTPSRRPCEQAQHRGVRGLERAGVAGGAPQRAERDREPPRSRRLGRGQSDRRARSSRGRAAGHAPRPRARGAPVRPRRPPPRSARPGGAVQSRPPPRRRSRSARAPRICLVALERWREPNAAGRRA